MASRDVQGFFAILGHPAGAATEGPTPKVDSSGARRPRADQFMRSVVRAGLCAALVAVALPMLAGSALAQSFLHSLLGLGQQPAQSQRPMPHPGAPAFANRGYGTPIREPGRLSAAMPGRWRESEPDEPRDDGGRYRTLCVRTCDGYYFPISNAVPRARFMRDAAQCRASCGEEGRLYYMAAGSDNTSTMLDLAGRSYVRMPTAFKYRKVLTPGCRCRPLPWSEAELRRHQDYAAEATRAKDMAIGPTVAAKPTVDPKPDSGARPADAATRTIVAVGGDPDIPPQTIPATEDDVASQPPPAVRPLHRVEGVRAGASASPSAVRNSERPSTRRQQAAAQAGVGSTALSSLGGSWLPSSGAKYTWPGDAPRR